MSITAFDSLVAAIIAKLQQAPALAAGVVDDETNFDELPPTIAAALRVTVLDSLPLNRAYGKVQWRSTIRVACMARSDTHNATTGRASSLLAAEVFSRLMADNTLGGKALRVEDPRIAPDVNFYLQRIGVQNLDFPIVHETGTRSILAA